MALILDLSTGFFTPTEQMVGMETELLYRFKKRLKFSEKTLSLIDKWINPEERDGVDRKELMAYIRRTLSGLKYYLKTIKNTEEEFDAIYDILTENLPYYLGDRGRVDLSFLTEGDNIPKLANIEIVDDDIKITFRDKSNDVALDVDEVRTFTVNKRFDLFLIKAVLGRLCTQYYRFYHMAEMRKKIEKEIHYLEGINDELESST